MLVLEILNSIGLNKVIELFSSPSEIPLAMAMNPELVAVTLLGGGLLTWLGRKLPGKRKKMVAVLKYTVWGLEWILDVAPKAVRVLRTWIQKLEDICPDGKCDL